MASNLWYTVQPREGGRAPSCDYLTPIPAEKQRENIESDNARESMQAKDIKGILCRKIAFLSGGKDRRGGHIVTIPNVTERYPFTEHAISTTLKYLSSVLGEERRFTVLLDVRTSTWKAAKPLVRILQYCLRDKIGLVCIVKPSEFWEKQRANFKFKKFKERLGFETILVSVEKLSRYINPGQLTPEFGGTLLYDHHQWIRNRINFEKYVAEAEEKLDFIQSVGSVAKSTQNTKSSSSFEYSDSGHATGQTHTSSSSNTPSRGRQNKPATPQEAPSPKPRVQSTNRGGEYVYRVHNGYRRGGSPDAPVPAPRTSVTSPPRRGSPVPPPRKRRSRSLPPERERREREKAREKKGSKTLRYEVGPAPKCHIYALPDNSSDSDQDEPSQASLLSSDVTRRNGPRYLRRRRDELDDHASRGVPLPTSRSVPNLAKEADKSCDAKRELRNALASFPNTTLKQGERLLEQLKRVHSETGFNTSPSQPISDEGIMMMETINQLQNILHKLEESSQNTKINEKTQKRVRRKTVTGIPELDQTSRINEELFTPRRIKENLQIVRDWVRGPGNGHLQQETTFGDSLHSVQSLVKKHSEILKKCTEPFTVLMEIKQMFQKIINRNGVNLNEDEFLPQWVVDLHQRMRSVEEQCVKFQDRLRRRGEILHISYIYHKSSDQIPIEMRKHAEVCKVEASLLDPLEAVQAKLDGLHYHHEKVRELHQTVVKSATSFLHKLAQHSQESQHDCGLNHYAAQVRQTVANIQDRVRRCESFTESSKVRLEHVLQLQTAQRDVTQAVEWLCDVRKTIQQTHRALGKSAKEVDFLMDQHSSIRVSAKLAYDNGNKHLSAISVLRRCLELSPPYGAPASPKLKRSKSSGQLISSKGKLLPTLEDAWDSFNTAWHERKSRLSVARRFHENVEQLFKRGSQLEVDLDDAYPSSAQIPRDLNQPHFVPLREAQYAFTDDVAHVMRMGCDLLSVMDADGGSISHHNDGDHQTLHTIQCRMEELDHLKSSVRSKWSRLKGDHVMSDHNIHRRSFFSSWVEGVNESTDWVRMKLVQCAPDAFDIGRNLKEATKLQKQHNQLLLKMREKEDVVLSLLEKEQQSETVHSSSVKMTSQSTLTYSSEQGSSKERKMHRAMSRSLCDLWSDLNALMARRHKLLDTSVKFYDASSKFGNQLTCMEQYLKWEELPADRSSAHSLIVTLHDMHECMLDASKCCTQSGRDLMKMLKALKANHPEQHKSSFGAACAAIECTLEALVERRNQIEYRYDKRRIELEHALKIREWEVEVDQIESWFDNTRESVLDDPELGSSKARTEAILCHMDQIKDQAQDKIEEAKSLVSRGRDDLKAFGADLVTSKSVELDEVGENFMKTLDYRRDELSNVVDFYNLVQAAENSLEEIKKKLMKGKFSLQRDEADEQYNRFISSINIASDPVIQKAELIISPRDEDELEGLEGLLNARNRVVTSRDGLLGIINRHRSDSSRIEEMVKIFFQNCEQLKKWTSEVAEGMLTTNGVIGNNIQTASQFIVWHKLLSQDVQVKCEDMETLVKTANELLDVGVAQPAQVRDRATEIKETWSNLHRKVQLRISVANHFVEFLNSADKAYEEIEKVRLKIAEKKHQKLREISPLEVKECEKLIKSVQEVCSSINQQANSTKSQLKETIPGDSLDSSDAAEKVSETLRSVYRKKSELMDMWLSWRYKSGVNSETDAQWKESEKIINRLMASLENLEQSVFVNEEVHLGEDFDSNLQLSQSLEDRQTLLQSIHTEIEKIVAQCEMIGLRTSPNTSLNTSLEEEGSGDETMRKRISALLARYQMLATRMKHYKTALASAKTCHELITKLRQVIQDSEKELMSKDSLRDVVDMESSPQKESLVTVLLRSHGRMKTQVDDLMNSVTSSNYEVHQIINRHELGQLQLSQGQKTLDDITMEVSVFYSHWKKLWQNYQDKLEAQQISAWFTHGYNMHRKAIQDFESRLHELDDHLFTCKVKSRAVMLQDDAEQLLKDINTSKKEWDEFVYSSKERLRKDNPRFNRTKNEMGEIDREMKNTSARASKAVGSAKTLMKFYSLTEECEAWNNDLKEMVESIRKKSSSIRTSDEANDLVDLLGKKVLGRLEEQTDRTQRFASIIVEAEERESEDQDAGGERKTLPFRRMMKNKQSDVLESVQNLRCEVDNLHNLLEGVRSTMHQPPHQHPQLQQQPQLQQPRLPQQQPEVPVKKVEPYDMSVLLDENLKAEKREVKSSPPEVEQSSQDLPPPPDARTLDLLKVPEREEPQNNSHPTTDTSSSSVSLSSASEEYFLESNYSDSDVADSNEQVLTARKADDAPKQIPCQDTSLSSFESPSVERSPSASSSFTTNSRGQTPPPKPPRNGRAARQRRRKFWERDLDQYAASWIADRNRSMRVGSDERSGTDESEKVYYRFA